MCDGFPSPSQVPPTGTPKPRCAPRRRGFTYDSVPKYSGNLDFVPCLFTLPLWLPGMFDLPYSVELWDEADTRVEELIALTAARTHRHPKTKDESPGGQQEADMTRIYVSDHGSDSNDGLTKRTPIYSWKRARKLVAGHLEISVESASARKRLFSELCTRQRAVASKSHC